MSGRFLRVFGLLSLLFIVACTPLSNSTKETDTGSRNTFQNKITKYDKKGRVQVSEMVTEYGTCMTEVAYTGEKKHPQIHILVIKSTGARNVGYLLIRDATEETITNSVLVALIDEAVTEHCLPHILPGYNKV